MLKISQFLPPRKRKIKTPAVQEPQIEQQQQEADEIPNKVKSKKEPGYLGILWDSFAHPEVRGMPWDQYVRQYGRKRRRHGVNWINRWLTPSKIINNIVGK